MSADNGYIIRKKLNEEGELRYVLQMYFASDDELPPISQATDAQTFATLVGAVLSFSRLGDQGEYGLRIMIEEFTE